MRALFEEVSHDVSGMEATLHILSAMQAENQSGMGNQASCPHVAGEEQQGEVKYTTGQPAMTLAGKGLDAKELQRQLEESKEWSRRLEAELLAARNSSKFQVTSPRAQH